MDQTENQWNWHETGILCLSITLHMHRVAWAEEKKAGWLRIPSTPACVSEMEEALDFIKKSKQIDPSNWTVSLHVPWVRGGRRLKQGARWIIKRHEIKRHGNGAGMDTKPEKRCDDCCKTTKCSSLNLIFKISQIVKILHRQRLLLPPH